MNKDKLGKIDSTLFREFIQNKCGFTRPEVKTKPSFGVDVSVVEIGNGLAMALTSDPLSLIPSLGLEESAWLSVHLLANDMATTGFAPMYGQFVLNLPAQFSSHDFQIYWNYIHQFCKEIGVSITGGHTGFIEGQNSTIAGGGTFITIASKNELLISMNAKPGDAILVTKSCAISSAAILAMCFPDTVRNKLGKEIYNQARESFYQTTSLKEALLAKKHFPKGVTAMHDVTEGGVLGAIHELSIASGNGAEIWYNALPIGKTQEEVCKLFSLDPRNCVGAGAMIITCEKLVVKDMIDKLKCEGIHCSEVGTITEKEKGVKLIEDDNEVELVYTEEDPYWAAFFKALKNGWK